MGKGLRVDTPALSEKAAAVIPDVFLTENATAVEETGPYNDFVSDPDVWLVFHADDGSPEGCSTYYSWIVEASTKREAIRKVRLLRRTPAEIAAEDADELTYRQADDPGIYYELGDGGYTAEPHKIIR